MDRKKTKQITVIGAGIVGVTTALTLQREGYQVLLIDKNAPPGAETSFGNAGLLASSTMVPMNHPGLWKQMPSIAFKQSNYVRYNLKYLLQNSTSFINYLSQATAANTLKRAKALKSLVYPSIKLHKQWIHEAGVTNRLRENGWLKLFTTKRVFNQAATEIKLLKDFDVDIQLLDRAEISDLEPNLPNSFCQALWVRDTLSVDNPGAICKAYFDMYISAGGEFLQADVSSISQTQAETTSEWAIITSDQSKIDSEQLVICLGAWSKTFLEKVNLKLPLIYEKGGHRIFRQISEKTISRPILDVDGGFVITPMEGNYRLTCGVTLSSFESAYNWSQLNTAEKTARTRFPLGDTAKDREDWNGIRPVLPDYLPVIGETKRKGLWINCGHHHIGLTMSPESAVVLVDMIKKRDSGIESPFSPARFGV